MFPNPRERRRPRAQGAHRLLRPIVLALIVAPLLAAACGSPQAGPAAGQTPAAAAGRPGQPRSTPRTDPVPANLARGEQLYQSHCAECHGQRGSGTDRGPTFLTPIYAPDHHGDQAFVIAPQQGVQAHHWRFGPMPPVPGLTEPDLREIVKFVRWFQGLS